MMQSRIGLVAAAAIISVGAPLCGAQNSAPPVDTQPSAPIERAYPNQNPAPYGHYPGRYDRDGDPYDRQMSPRQMPAQVTMSPGSSVTATAITLSAIPIPGVFLRVAPNSSVKEVVSNNDRLELRVESGLANLDVHDPQKNILLLVDLPGGQTQMLKNGLYTFNAATNTARVLKGEALAFPASSAGAEPLKVKEYNKIEFGKDTKPHEFIPQQAVADMIPGPRGPENGYGSGYGYNGYAPGYRSGYAPYGDGYYSSPYGYYPSYGYYPYWGFVEPYPWFAWGYPYGFYPWGGIGIGFGYYGGWGFHGRGFRGHR